mgnify:FL=1
MLEQIVSGSFIGGIIGLGLFWIAYIWECVIKPLSEPRPTLIELLDPQFKKIFGIQTEFLNKLDSENDAQKPAS